MKTSVILLISAVFINFLIGCSSGKQETFESNNIRDYLIQKATEISDNSLSEIKTLGDWQNIRDRRYDELVEMMGLSDMPLNGDRSALNVKITGIIQENGYRIEKLYYESLPGLYVRANLYVPDNISNPKPGILYVCGHSRTQKFITRLILKIF
jgi:hypothetical protein